MPDFQRIVDDGISPLPGEIFSSIYEKDYKSQEAYHRIIQDLNSELETKDSYRGREVLEMLQNAEDQGSDFMAISVNTQTQDILFFNGGKPFSKKGFDAILYAKTSPKIGNLSSIGNKGLGFRSILNWGDQVEIYSRHVHCSFSSEIALRKWTELKKYFQDNKLTNNLLEIEENLKRQKLSGKKDIPAPTSIFAVPDYESYTQLPFDIFPDFSEKISTVVKVKYKKEEIGHIQEQLSAVLNAETLLFLSNLKKIVVKIDDEEQSVFFNSIKPLPNQQVENIFDVAIQTKGGSTNWVVAKETGIYSTESIEVDVYKEEDNYTHSTKETIRIEKKYQIGVATNVKTTNENITNPLYSYFATQVETGLPCILHGTFHLSPDRKQLEDDNDYNVWLEKKLGKMLCDFAEYMASNQIVFGGDRWLPFDILNFRKTPAKSLSNFANHVAENWPLSRVLPTLDGEYKKKKDVCWYSENFASLIASNSDYIQSGFGNHLIQEFSKRIDGCQDDVDFDTKLNDVSERINKKYEQSNPQNQDLSQRIAFLINLHEINFKCNDKYKLRLVVDEKGNLLTPQSGSKLYVNTGVQLNDPPSILGFHYVDKRLVDLLKTKWNTDDRGVAITLQDFFDVTPTDISAIKKKISDTLFEEPDFPNYKAIISSLYKTPGIRFLTKSTVDGIPFEQYETADDVIMLLAQDNEYHPASELILDVGSGEDACTSPVIATSALSSRWKVWGTVAQWMEILEETDSQKIKNFFINTLGVSECIPKSPVGNTTRNSFNIADQFFEQLEQKTYHYHNDRIAESGKWNIAYNHQPDFIFELKETHHVDLMGILTLILKDSILRKSLLNNKLYYSLHTNVSQTTIKFGYTALMLRPIFEDFFKTIIVSESASLIKSISDASGANISDVENALVCLGAFRTEEDLSMELLYKRMADVATRFSRDTKIPVQTEYKKIRELIKQRKERHPEEIEYIPSYLAAPSFRLVVKHEGKQKTKPINEVYYWDNDKLPKKILKTFPKLMIGSRVGEDSVKEIFGVRLMKDVHYSITPASKRNESLGRDLIDNLKERYPYLLAVRCADADSLKNIKLFGDALNNLEIEAYSECEYFDEANASIKFKMDIGDLLIDKGAKCNICSKTTNYNSAVQDPKFCESLVEFLCIVLKASESNWFNSIRTIIKNSKQENEYFLKNEFSEKSYWREISKALGLSNEESEFWDCVSAALGKPYLDKKILTDQSLRLNHVQTVLDVDLSSRFSAGKLPLVSAMTPEDQLWLLGKLNIMKMGALGSLNKIQSLYSNWLASLQNTYSKAFFAYLQNQIESTQPINVNDVENFLDTVEKFEFSPVFENIPEECQSTLYDKTTFTDLIKSKIEVECGIQCTSLDAYKKDNPDILPIYERILAEFNRSIDTIEPQIKTYAYFSGFEDKFKELLKEKNAPLTEPEAPQTTQKPVDAPEDNQRKIKILDPDDWSSGTVTLNAPTSRRSRRRKSTFADSRELAQKGRCAELIVRDLLNESDEYEIVNEWSTNLNPSGDNSKHRDLDYKKIDSDEVRYLEVKAFSNGRIMMSSGEYDFAKKKENIELFDIALVDDKGRVNILISPFKDNRISLVADTYVAKIDIR